jgi:hypothetical protein
MNQSLKGTLKLKFETIKFESGFEKREFVITTVDDKYPQDVKFELVKEKTGIIEDVPAGAEVEVHFNIRGNEYNGKYYVNLHCWKLDVLEEITLTPPSIKTKPNTVSLMDVEEEDLPF